ncbi:hypothetical protein VB712_10300 [Spirulina sp. CCNP1310]|uniref:hypothetical protein n=1 Tax=Spirulina sp. CCNP1310 TaxID=3110249 RepID=UPI002B1F705E|nr:hypothetical protein [Spirulina sp. CCNP1310]MEA5419613.1 hypothetical protein [Spirulina sp. CCNP1310]
MSETQTLTLSSFFGIKSAVKEKANEFLDQDFLKQFTAQVGEEVKGMKLPPSFYQDLLNLILDKVEELVDIDLPRDIWAKAWSVHQALQEFTDPEKHPPDSPDFLPLLEHTLTTQHEPAIEPKIFGRALGRFALQANADFLINGALLEIENAKITKISLSDVKGNLSLTFFGKPLLEKTAELKIPGVFTLENGVLIKGPSEQGDRDLEEEAGFATVESPEPLTNPEPVLPGGDGAATMPFITVDPPPEAIPSPLPPRFYP